MFTEIDNREGLVKVYWHDVRERVKAVDPTFTKLVDGISPDKKFPLYLSYLPYGDFLGDTESTFLPLIDGGQVRLTDQNLAKDIIKHLGYGRSGAPFGMVLEKELEFFIDLKNENITIPSAVYGPGKFFSFGRNFSKKNNRAYAPNSVITISSGARSAFVLPNIGCVVNHVNLQRDYNIMSPPPKSLYEHWHLFKEILNSHVTENKWKSCILFFSEKWIEKILNDDAWSKIKIYLHEQAWQYFEYERNGSLYDVTFSVIQKQRNLKPNPYLTDTARHLFTTALGDAPGYAPACNENSLPTNILQNAFVTSYGLKKYFPTIMKPTTFLFESDKTPVYYSLQHPSTLKFSPKSRKISSTLLEIRELHHIMKIFIKELHKEHMMGADSVIGEVARKVEFDYFHNQLDRHHVIKPSIEILKNDKRFDKSSHIYKNPNAVFAADAPFLRGCIRIKTK